MDEKEFKKWIEEANSTFKAIDSDLKDGNFNWACFKAQQAAEFALKAFLWGCRKPAFGHSLLGLLTEFNKLKIEIPPRIREFCARLDKFYVPTRYANQWLEGAPHTYFTEKEAEEAKRMAKEVIRFVKRCWKLLKKKRKKRRSY